MLFGSLAMVWGEIRPRFFSMRRGRPHLALRGQEPLVRDRPVLVGVEERSL